MNKITKVFEELLKKNQKAFIPYLTAGDPDIETTEKILELYASNGADIIEIGVPFSDPMADGPVIQAAMERALKNSISLKKILNLVSNFKKKYSTPIILMGYLNPFFSYGFEKFAKDAKASGVDGILSVDLPPEEATPFYKALKNQEIISIFLATPVTNQKRLHAIQKFAEGFIYMVSVAGVTGERKNLDEGLIEKIQEVKKTIRLPVALGFGISSPEMIQKYYSHLDWFIVGSALINRMENDLKNQSPFEELKTFFLSLAKVCH